MYDSCIIRNLEQLLFYVYSYKTHNFLFRLKINYKCIIKKSVKKK
jgi:hypothetical protein